MKAVFLSAFALSLVAVGGASATMQGSDVLRVKPIVVPGIGAQKPVDSPAYVRAERTFAELEKTSEWREIVKALGTLRALGSLPALQELVNAVSDLEVKVAAPLVVEKIMKAVAESGMLNPYLPM